MSSLLEVAAFDVMEQQLAILIFLIAASPDLLLAKTVSLLKKLSSSDTNLQLCKTSFAKVSNSILELSASNVA